MSQRTDRKENHGKNLRQSVMGQFLSNPKSKGDNPKSKPSKKAEAENKTKLKKESTSIKRKVTGAGMFSSVWTRGAHRDTEDYRLGYPGKRDNVRAHDNYYFYTNRTSSQPDGDFIDNIHSKWKGNYSLLERHHGYIQWLFPIREEGMNWNAQALQLHEIEKIKSNRQAIRRVLKSYQLMLDFYGMVLVDEKTGVLERADNWKERFRHLNRSFHNYLRITRILKSLGEFGYEHLKANFVRFVLNEGMLENTLHNLIDSCVKYWIGVLRDDVERDEVFEYYEQLSEVPECDKKPRTRSPSPEYFYIPTAGATATAKKSIKKKQKEFSDEEDVTLEYAMTLIDSDDDFDGDEGGATGKGAVNEKGAAIGKPGPKIRVDHTLSESDDDEFKTPDVLDSVEADYWKKELEDIIPSLDVEVSSDIVPDDKDDPVENNNVKTDVIENAIENIIENVDHKDDHDENDNAEDDRVVNSNCDDDSRETSNDNVGNTENKDGETDDIENNADTCNTEVIENKNAIEKDNCKVDDKNKTAPPNCEDTPNENDTESNTVIADNRKADGTENSIDPDSDKLATICNDTGEPGDKANTKEAENCEEDMDTSECGQT